jgi:hypothetical protein
MQKTKYGTIETLIAITTDTELLVHKIIRTNIHQPTSLASSCTKTIPGI